VETQLSAAIGPSLPSNQGELCLKKVVDEQPTSSFRSARLGMASIKAATNCPKSGMGRGGAGGGGGGGGGGGASPPLPCIDPSSL